MRNGTLEMDVLISFLIILSIFIISAQLLYEVSFTTSKKTLSISNVYNAIVDSYIILDNARDYRDNEVTMNSIQNAANNYDANIKLYSVSDDGSLVLIFDSGDVYLESYCINRAVYIRDIKRLGVLKVCHRVR